MQNSFRRAQSSTVLIVVHSYRRLTSSSVIQDRYLYSFKTVRHTDLLFKPVALVTKGARESLVEMLDMVRFAIQTVESTV